MRDSMRAVIYGKPRQRECSAVAEGLTALGHSVLWRNHGYFSEGDALPDVDLVVTFGQRLHSAAVAREYRSMGVPVLTVDLPPVREPVEDHEQAYRALWLDHVNWLPDERCSDDRAIRIGWPVRSQRAGRGRRVLVCGQTADDAAHGMDAASVHEWARSTLEAIAEFHPVDWRPHPRHQFTVPGFEAQSYGQSLDETLYRGDWWAVVSFNSTAGLTALMQGIPIFCDESCFYSEVANTSLSAISDPWFPTRGQLAGFFSRLAHVQWTFDELASGEAVSFVLRHAGETHQELSRTAA